MANATCSIDGCENLVRARGWCGKHYQRWANHGDPLTDLRRRSDQCAVDGCERLGNCCGFCHKHWRRWRTHGDPLGVSLRRGDFERRFWSKVNMAGPLSLRRPDLGRCWIWTANRPDGRYGQVSKDDHPLSAHRTAYELTIGPIPDGFDVDHLCMVLPCVRPGHLDAVTPEENRRRAIAAGHGGLMT